MIETTNQSLYCTKFPLHSYYISCTFRLYIYIYIYVYSLYYGIPHTWPCNRSNLYHPTDPEVPYVQTMIFQDVHHISIEYTLWLFNIAMENGPCIDGLPIKNGDFQWLCSITRGYLLEPSYWRILFTNISDSDPGRATWMLHCFGSPTRTIFLAFLASGAQVVAWRIVPREESINLVITGGFHIWGIPQASVGWFISWKIPSINGWQLGVPPF